MNAWEGKCKMCCVVCRYGCVTRFRLIQIRHSLLCRCLERNGQTFNSHFTLTCVCLAANRIAAENVCLAADCWQQRAFVQPQREIPLSTSPVHFLHFTYEHALQRIVCTRIYYTLSVFTEYGLKVLKYALLL